MDVMQDDGTAKAMPFRYIADALSLTEAEARVIEEVKPYAGGSLDVESAKKVRIQDVFPCADELSEKWWRAKIVLTAIDEKTQEEKETAWTMLAQAGDFHSAVERIEKGMKGSLADWRLVKLEETQIMDVFVYKKA